MLKIFLKKTFNFDSTLLVCEIKNKNKIKRVFSTNLSEDERRKLEIKDLKAKIIEQKKNIRLLKQMVVIADDHQLITEKNYKINVNYEIENSNLKRTQEKLEFLLINELKVMRENLLKFKAKDSSNGQVDAAQEKYFNQLISYLEDLLNQFNELKQL